MNINIEEICCANCKCLFWVTEDHQRRLRKSKETFYCPNGHPQSYTGKSDAERLADAQKTAKEYWKYYEEERDKAESLRKSVQSYKGHMGKLKKKVALQFSKKEGVYK